MPRELYVIFIFFYSTQTAYNADISPAVRRKNADMQKFDTILA